MTAAKFPFLIKLLFILSGLVPAIVYGQDQTTPDQQARVAQLNQLYDATNFKATRTETTGVPSFFEPEGTRGSQYLSRHWLAGTVHPVDSQSVIVKDFFAFNYDKVNDRLVATKDGRTIVTIPYESISNFVLVDSGHAYSFEKFSFINHREYFQPIVKSVRKFSLYKHQMTRIHAADYTSIGYASFGKRYNEYIDSYEYYIVFPGQQEFQKFSLNKKSVLKALKEHSGEVEDFFNAHNGPLTEEFFSELIESVNEKMP